MKPTPHIIIHVEGGIVQDVLSSEPLDFTIIDYDTDGCDESNLFECPQGDGKTTTANYCARSASVTTPERMEEIIKATELAAQKYDDSQQSNGGAK